METKKLYKDKSNKMICGVCSGIAKFFSLDPTVVRLALAAFCLLGGSGILAYIVCAIVIPDEPDIVKHDDPDIVDV